MSNVIVFVFKSVSALASSLESDAVIPESSIVIMENNNTLKLIMEKLSKSKNLRYSGIKIIVEIIFQAFPTIFAIRFLNN